MKIPPSLSLPRNLSDINAEFMTTLLRDRRVISQSNSVVSQEETDVGMTAGYFSAIKRVKCQYAETTDAQDTFIVKAWPDFELLPKDNIKDMFELDIKGYLFDKENFYPRPNALLADFNAEADQWALIMEDACTFAEQKLHEKEMSVDEVMRMIPRMVDTAVAWEGCEKGEKSRRLDEIGVDHWASEKNLMTFKSVMPGGAKLFDYVTSMSESSLVGHPTWKEALGPGFSELFTNKIEAFYERAKTENGATCTLSHGDLRGDNIFFCDPSDDYPDGWLAIDFQLMFRGPIPSDLAYLMNSGSVLPDVYEERNRTQILKAFYDQFLTATTIYKDYTWEQFESEYAMMATVQYVYYVGFGAAIWQAGVDNEQPGRIELGDKGATLDDLAPDEVRKRMWWKKALANFRTNFKDYNQYQYLQELPLNTGEMGQWFELPVHLQKT